MGFEGQRRLAEFEWVGQGSDQGYLLWCEEEGREEGGRRREGRRKGVGRERGKRREGKGRR